VTATEEAPLKLPVKVGVPAAEVPFKLILGATPEYEKLI
jgi:hypothetical protein